MEDKKSILLICILLIFFDLFGIKNNRIIIDFNIISIVLNLFFVYLIFEGIIHGKILYLGKQIISLIIFIYQIYANYSLNNDAFGIELEDFLSQIFTASFVLYIVIYYSVQLAILVYLMKLNAKK